MQSIILDSGKVLTIRKATGKDAVQMLDYLKTIGGESDNLTFGAEGIPLTVAEEASYLDKLSAHKIYTSLIGLVQDEIVSAISINGNDRPRLRHNAELGISVRKDYWHQGIAKAMIGAMLDFVKKVGIVNNIHLNVRIDNLYAIRLYESFGFVKTGIYPKQLHIRGQYFDTQMMNLILDQKERITL